MVSFIIPAYNEEKLINATLSSVFAQHTSEPFEVIVVDDNSTDGTAELVARYFPSVKLVHEARQGTTWARNCGAQEAHGEFLAFIDADISVPPNWTECMLGYFHADENVAAVSGPYRYFPITQLQRFWQWLWYYIVIPPVQWFFCKMFRVSSVIYGGNFMVRKSSFDAVKGFDTRFNFWGEDTDLAKRLMKKGEVLFKMDVVVGSTTRGLHNPDKGALKNFLLGISYIIKHSLNFVWVSCFNKPFSKKIQVVR
jgi:glycosyltransferase involved in cell wall biosynthesis